MTIDLPKVQNIKRGTSRLFPNGLRSTVTVYFFVLYIVSNIFGIYLSASYYSADALSDSSVTFSLQNQSFMVFFLGAFLPFLMICFSSLSPFCLLFSSAVVSFKAALAGFTIGLSYFHCGKDILAKDFIFLSVLSVFYAVVFIFISVRASLFSVNSLKNDYGVLTVMKNGYFLHQMLLSLPYAAFLIILIIVDFYLLK